MSYRVYVLPGGPGSAPPFPPMSSPVLVNEHDEAMLPHAFRAGYQLRPLCRGLALAWAPWPGGNYGVLLVLQGGNPAAPTDEAVATFVSTNGLRRLIANLTSIADQMEQGHA